MAATNRGELDVVVVVDSLRDNGGLRVAAEYARQWDRLGSHATLLVVQDVNDATLADLDASVRREFLTPHSSRFRWSWPLALMRLVARVRRADVVVAGSETGIGLVLAYAAARIARRPFVVLVQADLADAISYWVSRPLQGPTRWVHRKADAAIAVADSLVPGIIANGLPADRISVVLNGIDVARVRRLAGLPEIDGSTEEPATARTALEQPTVVAHGRLSDQKDYPLLLRAHAKVKAGGVDHKVVIIGDGPVREELEELVVELGLEGSVELAGYVDNPYTITSTADLFVLSSRTEGMPLTVMEALAVGAPVVATRCGTGVEVLLEDGTYGDLVPTGSVDELAAAMERNLREPDDLRGRAAAGPRRAMHFDVTTSARTILDTLHGLAEPGHRVPAGQDRSPTGVS